jgi:hypothetical protein
MGPRPCCWPSLLPGCSRRCAIFGSILGSAGLAAILAGDTRTTGAFRLLFALLLVAAFGAIVSAALIDRVGRAAPVAAPSAGAADGVVLSEAR